MAKFFRLSAMGHVAFVFLAYLPVVIDAYAAYHVWAACIGCWASQINVTNPCANIRTQITNQVNANFKTVFLSFGFQPSSTSWVFEQPVRRDLVGANGTALTPEEERELGPISCRSLCSTYPDCSAWCPNGGRRLGQEEEGQVTHLRRHHRRQKEEGEESGAGLLPPHQLDPRELQVNDDMDFIRLFTGNIYYAGRQAFLKIQSQYNASMDRNCYNWLTYANCVPKVLQLS